MDGMDVINKIKKVGVYQHPRLLLSRVAEKCEVIKYQRKCYKFYIS